MTRFPRHHPGIGIGAAWLVACCGCALGQQVIQITPEGRTDKGDEVARPNASGRVVKVFDFEERRSNPGEVPQHWFRAQDFAGHPRPGFPGWNKPELRYTDNGASVFAGEGSVTLPTQGGSTSLILSTGVLPVFQNADYLVSAKVRTQKLVHAKACVAARFLDKSGTPIAGTDVRTGVVTSNDAWADVSVEMVGDQPGAAYIQLELLLLQPEQLEAGLPTDPRRIWEQDLDGAAWFDDVAVVQLPRIELSTASPINVFTASEQPEIKLLVRDLTGEELVLRLEVLDVQGRTADQLSKHIGAGFTTSGWKPKLSRLGWYRAIMDITTVSGSRVGRSYVDFVWALGGPEAQVESAGEGVAWADRARLGLAVQSMPNGVRDKLPLLVGKSGAGSVTIPVWDSFLTLEQVPGRTESLRPVVDALLAQRRGVTLSFDRIPDGLARDVQVDTDDPWVLFTLDPKTWMPYAAPLLERFGPRVNHWQVGGAGDDRALWRGGVGAEAATISDKLSRLVPGPVLAIPSQPGRPWPSKRSEGGVSPALVQGVGAGVTPQGVGLAAKAWNTEVLAGTGASEMMLVLRPMEALKYGTGTGAIETVKRVVEFWNACSQDGGALTPGASISLEQPWDWTASARRPQLMPRPELAVWKNLTERLVGRRVVGTYPAGAGVVCYVLAPAPGTPPSQGGALVAWNESPEQAALTGDFGAGPLRVIDIYGNADAAAQVTTSKVSTRPSVRVPLATAPVFIEGIDVELVRFVSALTIEPAFLESSNDQHEREIVVSNPWGSGISGQVTILEPGGFDTGQKDRTWRISPRTQRFSVSAGKTERLPLKIAFSPVEEVGPKEFVLAVALNADQPYGTIEVRRMMEVGVKAIGLELGAVTQGPGGADLVVEAVISNTGQGPMTLEVTAFAEGFPRSKDAVTNLPVGNQVIKRFVYPGAAKGLRGQRVMISVFDPETKMRVNKSVGIK